MASEDASTQARPSRLKGRLRAFRDERAGNAGVLMALLGTLLIGTTALSLDGATFFLAKRKQQAATDLAAMAAAASPGQAAASAATLLAANGYAAATLRVETGRFVADASLAATARFQPDASASANAVRVTATTTQPFIFGGALQALAGGTSRTAGQPAGVPIRTAAVARKQDLAAFTLGSGVAALDGGLLNALLGSLLGTKLSLSLLDYQSLAAARLDLFDFGDAVASRIGLSGPSYGTLAAQVVTRSTLLSALGDALTGNAAAAAVARGLAAAVPAGSGGSLGRLIDFGPAGDLTVGTGHPLAARVSALDLLTALARLCGDGRLASLDLGVTLPGLGSTQLMFALGEPAQGSGYAAVGSEGATLHTAQIRLLLTTQVAAPALPGALTLSLVLDGAPATATLDAISCAAGVAQAGVTLGVTPGLATLQVGSLSAADVARLAMPAVVGPATVLDVPGLVSVMASGQATMAAANPIPVGFKASDIRAGTEKTVSSPVSLADALAGVMRNTSLSVTLLGARLPLPGLAPAIQAALAASVTPLDQALERILALMGVSVGNATTSVTGIRCGQGLLVQ